jgi:hypothetical protein
MKAVSGTAMSDAVCELLLYNRIVEIVTYAKNPHIEIPPASRPPLTQRCRCRSKGLIGNEATLILGSDGIRAQLDFVVLTLSCRPSLAVILPSLIIVDTFCLSS